MNRRYIAGQRTSNGTSLNIDLTDIIRQAVDNERWKVLRQVRYAIERIGTQAPGSSSWENKHRPGSDVKLDILQAIDHLSFDSPEAS